MSGRFLLLLAMVSGLLGSPARSAQAAAIAFASAVNYGVGTQPYSVVVGDLNGDGKLDLAVANAYSNTLSALLNAGSGTFASAVNYPAGPHPHSLPVADPQR